MQEIILKTEKRLNMKKAMLLITITLALLLTSCAKFWDGVDAKGGIVGSSKAPYIIINQSGGHIMDVYKLTHAIVQSPEGSDGWLFKDNDGNPIYLGGDVKTIRLKSAGGALWDKYHEYHMEFETLTYREKYGK